MLRDAGLVTDRREGTLIYYRLRDERVAELLTVGRQAAPGEESPSGGRPDVPDGPVPGCPCPRCQAGGEV
jgi:hypothetical protein